MASEKVHRQAERFRKQRKIPTPTDLARYQALKLVVCWGCMRFRFSLYMRDDGTCAWCHEEPPRDVEVEEHRRFARQFRKRYLRE